MTMLFLQRRQEELEQRARDLERREQELRNAPYNGNSQLYIFYFMQSMPLTQIIKL